MGLSLVSRRLVIVLIGVVHVSIVLPRCIACLHACTTLHPRTLGDDSFI
jgi:hypothetical protein